MKKDDELLESRTDDEEDIFNLSLDDLETEDAFVEPHVEEADEEIIELIDLVEKEDINLGEEDIESSTPFNNDRQPAKTTVDELEVDETLDLLDIPLDQELEFDEFEEFITDKAATLEDKSEIEDALEIDIADLTGEQPIHDKDTGIRSYTDGTETPDPVQEMKLEDLDLNVELEQPAGLVFIDEKADEKLISQQDMAPEKKEPPQPPLSDEKLIGISEEKIEAILRKIIEEVVERVARETMTNVSEKIITNAINVLKKSIESASD